MNHSHEERLAHTGVSPSDLLALEGLSEATDAGVFVSGSVIEGMGHRCSDIDVFVVGDARPRGEHIHREGGAVISVHMLGSRRVDFEFWEHAQLEALAKKLDALDLRTVGEPGALVLARRMDEKELSLIHRVRTGVPLVHPARFETIRGAFDFAKAARFLSCVRVRDLDPMLEDLYGMLEVHDPEFAVPRARELLTTACDALLHHLGSTNVRRKWRSRILESLRGTPEVEQVRDKYWALQFAEVGTFRTNRHAYETYLKECIKLTNRITNWIV